MKLKEVAVISGKPGLYQILKPTRNGVIIEAIGGGRSKIMADASHRISILKEISIYTTTEEGSVPLQDVFHKMYEKYALKMDIKTSDNDALKGLLNDILPEWDKDRVYTSDIKKLVMWYGILAEHAPELIDPAQKEEEEEEETPTTETKSEESAEEPKAKTKKATKKVDAMVEAETTATEEKPKKKTAKKDDKETKAKKTVAKKTDKPSAKTQKPTSKAATKAVKGKRGDK
ncbi:DUF5606 domain-containing protein [Bernardetia sp. MNP-M8]|uniref:DUF5606 family protein n=1 Tax=Bernardetia sp. MNP-M8 TaxID=3127470 RepID=UPI0030CDD7A0